MSDKETIESCGEDSQENSEKIVECTNKPKLSFGINAILGERKRSRSLSPTISLAGTTEQKEDSDHDNVDSDNDHSRSSSPVTSPTLSTSKYDESFAQNLYPLDLASSALLPLAGCGLYRGTHGVVKVPAQRPHPMLHMFNPYNIPWIDFRRDRYGG